MEKDNIEKRRTLRNLCAARVFLNIFGLTLGDVNETMVIKIFDNSRYSVGELSIIDNEVLLNAFYNGTFLKANYMMPKELNGKDNGLLTTWTTDIKFTAQSISGRKTSGSIWLSSTLDSEKGIRCLCQPLIKTSQMPGQDITIKMRREIGLFTYVEHAGDMTEEIKIAPSDMDSGFIVHDITRGKRENMEPYSYRKIAGIWNGADKGEDSKKLKTYRLEERHGEILDLLNEMVPKVGDDSSHERLLQKCELMKQIDPSMYEKIKVIREKLLIGDVSLFDNLISVCYEGNTDEEILALFGLDRLKMRYQNGETDLSSSYYDDKCFASYRKLVKSLKESNKK